MNVGYEKTYERLYICPNNTTEMNPAVTVDGCGVTVDFSTRETALKVRDVLLKVYPLEEPDPDMLEEPTEPGIYITQTKRCLLKSLTCWWRAMDKYMSPIDGFWCNGSNAAHWDDVCKTLPASEFPLIRLNTEA